MNNNHTVKQYEWLIELIKTGNAMAQELANMAPVNDYCNEHGVVPCRCKVESAKIKELHRQQVNYWNNVIGRMHELFLIQPPDDTPMG